MTRRRKKKDEPPIPLVDYEWPPYGYRMADGIVVLDWDEQQTIKAIIWLRRRGMAATQMARSLTKLGHKPRAKAWTTPDIETILRRL